MKKQSFIKNAIVLTTVTMSMQVVELYVGIYFSKLLGTEGIGIFQLMMSVFGLSTTIGLGGFSIAVTRIVAKETELGSIKSAKCATNKAILISLTTSGIVCFLMIFFSKEISTLWIKNELTMIPLIILALSMPFTAISICLDSYFISVGRIYTISLIIVNDQFLTVICVLGLIDRFPDSFLGKCIAITLSGLIATILSIFIRVLLYIFPSYRGKNSRKTKYSDILSISFPIGMSSCIRSFLNMLQNMLIPIGLMKFGYSHSEALSEYGMIKGMAIPVVVFPASIMSSFLALLIPEFSRSYETGNRSRINRAIMKASSLTIVFSIALTGILICYGEDMGHVVYENIQVGKYIKILAPLVTFMFLDDVVDTALKGLNEQLLSLKFNIIESGIRVVLLFFLVPQLGIIGYVFVIFFGNILNFVLSYNRLTQISDVFIDYQNWIIYPIITIVLSCLLTKTMLKSGILSSNYNVSIIIAIILTAAIFAVIVKYAKFVDYSKYNKI
ncbi:MAG: oligosaccharide flippase family protein [Oscillospiraceae bacterium]